jgi:hypothetical protein
VEEDPEGADVPAGAAAPEENSSHDACGINCLSLQNSIGM